MLQGMKCFFSHPQCVSVLPFMKIAPHFVYKFLLFDLAAMFVDAMHVYVCSGEGIGVHIISIMVINEAIQTTILIAGERLDLLDAMEKSLRDKKRAEAEALEERQEEEDDDFKPEECAEEADIGDNPGKGGKGKSSKNSRPKRSSARRS